MSQRFQALLSIISDVRKEYSTRMVRRGNIDDIETELATVYFTSLPALLPFPKYDERRVEWREAGR